MVFGDEPDIGVLSPPTQADLPQIRVLVVESQPVVLEGLRSVLARSADIQIVKEVTTGIEAIAAATELATDVILMDVELAEGGALAAIVNLRLATPSAKIIWFAPEEKRADFVEAVKAGCAGILCQDTPLDLIAKSIRRVHAGEFWLDSATTAAIIRRLSSVEASVFAGLAPKPPGGRVELSGRERQVTILIVQGFKNKDIATKMLITEQTVKNHIHNVFDKLGVSDRLELALYAVYHNLHESSEAELTPDETKPLALAANASM